MKLYTIMVEAYPHSFYTENMKKRDYGKWMMVVIILIVVISCGISVYVTNFVNTREGTLGFIREVMYRCLLVGVFVALAGMAIWRLRNPVRSFRTTVLCALAIVSVPVVGYYAFRNVAKDAENLGNPTTVYLSWLKFDDDTIGDGPSNYYVDGKGMDGEEHHFSISSQSYKEGYEMWLKERPLFAKVEYYPATEVVEEITFMYELDEGAAKMYETADSLEEEWDSYCFEVNGEVYHIATPVSAFLENGWSFENMDAMIDGNDDPYGDYGSMDVTLVSEAEQEIKVTLYNPQPYDIPARDAMVGSIYIIYGNYDYIGKQFRLPGGLMLYWSTMDDVIDSYGEPDEQTESSLSYDGRNGYQSLSLSFTDERLNTVRIHNFPYFKRD